MLTKFLSLCVALFAVAAVADDGRYIVEFKEGSPDARALSQAGAEVLLELPQHDAVAALIPSSAVAALRSNPNIISVEEDPRRYPLAEAVPYGIPMVQADQVTEGSYGAQVCIIDSGYYAGHEDLPQTGNITGSYDPILPWNEDGCGHGTHIAGTVAAIGNNSLGVVGINPGGTIRLHIVRVLDNSCTWAYSSDLVFALDTCRQANSAPGTPLVVNISLGGTSRSHLEQSSYDAAYRAGTLIVAGAGNYGSKDMYYPASYDSVISVAAVDANKFVAEFSQYNRKIELAAPGVGVLSTVPFIRSNNVSVDATTYEANHIEYSAFTDGTGVAGLLADGGLCDFVGSWSGMVVLCELGSIPVTEMLSNAESGGAIAALVHLNMYGTLKGTLIGYSGIPGLSLSQDDGQALVATSLGSEVTVIATTPTVGSGYEAWDGTSMATAHVSGVAALIWRNFPFATNQEIRDTLDATAEDLGDPGRDYLYGYGLVQAAAAYDFLAGLSSCKAVNENCGSDSDCCSLRCRGKSGLKVCR